MEKACFYIMNQKGYSVLKNFIEIFSTENIGYVVSNKDPNLEKDYFEDIKKLCSQNSIKFYDRKYFPPGEENNEYYKFAIGWRWLIYKLNKLIIFHDSLLPRYRGFAPLVNMLINGETTIGVTALKAEKEYDKGEIVLQKSIQITYPIKIQSCIELLVPLYIELVRDVFEKIKLGKGLNCTPQIESNASYSIWRDENDYQIDWSEDAEFIKRFIDSLGYPYKGASTFLHQDKYRIFDSEVVSDVSIENRGEHIGKVIFKQEKNPVVICGKGLLKINEICNDREKISKLEGLSIRSRFSTRT